ncbi:MAG: POTRA domain-containing protein [bacterium]
MKKLSKALGIISTIIFVFVSANVYCQAVKGIGEKDDTVKGDTTKKEMEKIINGINIDSEGEEIVNIKVTGTVNVPERLILDTMQTKTGQKLQLLTIMKDKKNIESLKCFEEVEITLGRSGEGKAIVTVEVKENPLVQKVKIEGNTIFSTDRIIKELSIISGKVLEGTTEGKKDIVEEMYYNMGYVLVHVTPIYQDSTLTFKIDEGRIDSIKVTGNNHIPTKIILDTLGIKEGDLYNKNKIKEGLKRLEDKLPLKADVMGNPKKEIKTNKALAIGWGTLQKTETKEEYTSFLPIKENDKNVLKISVKEQAIGDFCIGSEGYNRVQGLALTGTLTRKALMPNDLKAQILGKYDFSAKLLEYKANAEKGFFYPHSFTIGGEWKNIVDTQDGWINIGTEESISSFLLHRGYIDYYTRKGFGGWVSQVITPGNTVKIEYNADKYGSIEEKNVWSLFNNNEPWRKNPPINNGQMNSITIGYISKLHNKACELNSSIEIEKAGLGGDFEFNRYLINVTSNNELSPSHFFDFRIRGGYSGETLPAQERFRLGGLGSLMGYGYKEFSGNIMMLSNLVYRLGSKTPQLDILFDAGNCWEDRKGFNLTELKPSIGLGTQTFGGGLKLSIHRRLDMNNAPWITYLTLGKSF